MNVKKLKIIAAIIVVSTVILTSLLPSCGVHEQESGIKSLDELAVHSDILHFQEHKIDSNRLFELELWCIDMRAYYNDLVEYPNTATRPRLYADEVKWYSIRYQSGEEEVNGYIAAPADYLEKDYPVLIYNRGGYANGGDLSAEDLQYFARFGFIVLASKYRGSGDSTGKDGFGGEDVNDVIKLIDLAEEFTFTNGKIYMFGWSRGATQTYIVLSRDDRIDAAVAGAGPADIFEFYNEKPFSTEKMKSMIGGTPETHSAEYEARSAVCWPEKINTPLWIVHGKADKNVLAHHSEDLYNAFVAVGKDVKFTLFPGMDHGDPYWAFLPDYFYWLRQH